MNIYSKNGITMATIKSHTDIEQSRKLAEILPIESADMRYAPFGDTHPWVWEGNLLERGAIPCWSLAALLSVIPNYKLSSEHNYHTCTAETSFGKETVAWFDNPIDACYEMILKLNELKMLQL